MNDTTFSFLEFIFGLFLTITTLAYTFWSMTEWPDRFELVPSTATVFLEQTDIPEDVLWTGAQVVAKLYQLSDEENQDLVIDVDGINFETEEDVKSKRAFISLPSDYSQELVLNGDGQVTKIIYRKGV